MSALLHVATRTDWRSWLVRHCLAPKRNVGERHSDRLNGSGGLSGSHTPGEQRRRHFGQLRFYTQGLLPRDLLQQFVFTTAAAALPIRFAKSVTMAGGGVAGLPVTSAAGRSVRASGIDLHQSLSGVGHTPLRGPYPAAQGKIKRYATVLVQQLVRALQRLLGSAYSLSRRGEFQGQKVGRYPASVGFRVVHHELLTHGGAVRSLMLDGCGGSPHGSVGGLILGVSAVCWWRWTGRLKRMTRLPLRSRSRAAGLRSVAVIVLLDDYRLTPVVMPGRGGAHKNDSVVMMPVPGTLAVIVKRHLAMVPMVETLTVFVDDHVVVLVIVVVPMVSVACGDDHVGHSRGSHCRRSQAQRQSAQNQCFHGGVLQGLNALRCINCRRTHWFRLPVCGVAVPSMGKDCFGSCDALVDRASPGGAGL
jgi:hypothetical protein